MEKHKPSEAQVLEQLLQAAQGQRLTVEQVILFGSHARAEAGPDSDYDLLVLVPDATSAEQQWRAAGALSFDLGYALAWPVDVIVSTPAVYARRHDPMVESARRSGRVLFSQAYRDAVAAS